MARRANKRHPRLQALPAAAKDHQQRNTLDGMGFVGRARLQPARLLRMEADGLGVRMNAIHDHGENDPIPFDLGSWAPVAAAVRRELEAQTGRALTDVEVMA